MFRKFILGLGAAAALAATALAPTSASAWGGWHHHSHGWGHGYRYGFFAPVIASTLIAAAPSCYIVKKYVETPYGLQLRRVEVCE